MLGACGAGGALRRRPTNHTCSSSPFHVFLAHSGAGGRAGRGRRCRPRPAPAAAASGAARPPACRPARGWAGSCPSKQTPLRGPAFGGRVEGGWHGHCHVCVGAWQQAPPRGLGRPELAIVRAMMKVSKASTMLRLLCLGWISKRRQTPSTDHRRALHPRPIQAPSPCTPGWTADPTAPTLGELLDLRCSCTPTQQPAKPPGGAIVSARR